MWYAREHWLYATCTSRWHAYALWGSPSEADVVALTDLFTELEPTQTPHAIVADVRHLRDVAPAAFLALARYVRDHAEVLEQLVSSAWILHDASLVGAVATGFFAIHAPPFPVRTTRDPAVVCADQRITDADWDGYENALADARHDDGFLATLHTNILASTDRPTLNALARCMSVSPRSLQRRLSSANTTLAREISRVRVQRAQTLLTTTSSSITEIALSLGFATPEHFSTTFREATGETPSAYRERTTGASR